MKTILRFSAIFSLVLCPSVATRAGAPLKLTPFGTVSHSTFFAKPINKDKLNDLQQSHILVTRGGSEGIQDDKDLIATASDGFLVLFAALSAFHGFVLACVPSIGRQLLGTGVQDDDDIAVYAEEGVGVFTIEYGLTAFLAARGKMSPEMAIGYGTIPDLLFLGA